MSTEINVGGENRGLIAGRDIKDVNLINVGDVEGSYNAIGIGARVIINQIQQARSEIEELAAEIKLAEMQLADAVADKILKLTEVITQQKTISRRNPYRSLLDYRLEDTPYFYGRDKAISDLLGKIHNDRLTILHADSGSGKSSLLQAGLMSRLLAAGHLPLYFRSYRQEPEIFIKKTFLSDIDVLPELMRFQKMSLVGYLHAVSNYLGDSTLYLFLDQFEEFFTDLPREKQNKFAQDLADCLDDRGLDVRWVISLRKEQFSDLNFFRPKILPFVNELFLPTFNLDEAKQVITAPAKQQGIIYENEELIETILADLREQDGSLPPPQVQIVCYTLFEDAISSITPGLITLILYNQPRRRGFGGVKGILNNHLARTLANMPATERKLAGRILERLVSSKSRRIGIVHSKLLAVFEPIPADNVEKVLYQLVQDRLLRLDEDENDEPIYELAHDYLLAEIELDEEILKRKFAQELLNQQVDLWISNRAIRIAQETLEIIEKQKNALQLDANSEELLNLSREVIEQRRRIVRYSFGTAGTALLIAIIAGILATLFSLSARSAQEELAIATITTQAVQLATDVQVLLAGSIPPHQQILETAITAVEILIENKIAIPPSVEQSLRKAIVSDRLLAVHLNPTNAGYQALSLSDDGTMLITGNSDNNVHFYSIQSKEIQTPIERRGHTAQVLDLSSVRNGLIASIGQEAIVWDIRKAQSIFQTETNNYKEFAIELDPTGQQLVIGGAGSFRLYELYDDPPSPHWVHLASNTVIRDIQFDVSGEYLITGSDDKVVRIWRIADESVVWESTALAGEVVSIAIAPNNAMLAVTARDQLFVWWRAQDQAENQLRFNDQRQVGGHQSYIRQVKFNADGSCLATAGDDMVIRLWNAVDLRLIATLDGHQDRIDGIAFKPYVDRGLERRFTECGKELYSVGRDKTIRRWNISAPAEVATFTDFTQPVEALDITKSSMLATADQDGTVSVFDLKKFAKRNSWRQLNGRLGDVKFTPNEQTLVTAGYDDRIVFWDWNADHPSKPLFELLGHDADVLGINFNTDGSRLISTSRDFHVKTWDVATQQVIDDQVTAHHALDAMLSPIYPHLLATASFSDSRLWNRTDGNSWILDEKVTYDVEFFQQRALLVTAGEGGINLWTIEHKGLVSGPINLWVEDESSVISVAVAEKLDLLAVGTLDGKIVIWRISDIVNSTNLHGRVITRLGSAITDLVIDTNQQRIVVASEDGTVRVLELSIDKLLQIAKARYQNYQQ